MSADFLLTISCFRIKIYSRDSRAGNCGGNLVLVSDVGDALRGRYVWAKSLQGAPAVSHELQFLDTF